MQTYLIKRVIYALLVMWGVATIVFFMMRAIPGDPVRAIIGFEGDPAQAEILRHELGLDQPFYVQYARWMGRMLQGDLGNSIWNKQPVTSLILISAPRTLSLAILGFFIALAIAIPAGIISAVRKNSIWDHGLTMFAFLGLSMPDFWFGVLLIMFFAVHLGWLPAFGYVELSRGFSACLKSNDLAFWMGFATCFPKIITGFWPWFERLLLPAIAIGTGFSAILARITRSSLLEVFNEEYIKAARAKGVREFHVVMKHAFRNAFIPIITVMGISFALLLGGAVIVENVFAIKGLGRLLVRAISNRDYPIVQGTILVIAGIFVFINLIIDVLYTVINPKIRYEE